MGKSSPFSTDVIEATPGELKPENALVDVVVHRDLRQGIQFPGTGVAVPATGINSDQPATVRKNRVFWANVQVDTDLMVNMLPDGVETYDILRSQQSPERLSYEVDIPEGGGVALDAEKQTIDINDKDGKPVAHVGPPHAVDADGALVPRGGLSRARCCRSRSTIARPTCVIRSSSTRSSRSTSWVGTTAPPTTRLGVRRVEPRCVGQAGRQRGPRRWAEHLAAGEPDGFPRDCGVSGNSAPPVTRMSVGSL